MKQLIRILRSSKNAAVFTGAGISTLCGIPDFRGPQGLYRKPDAEKIFDIAWFQRDPSIYYQGCRDLIYGTADIRPGPVHKAIARLEQAGILAGVITQNIDMLHQKAGSRVVHEIHGSPLFHHCVACGRKADYMQICELLREATVAKCEECGAAYKPDVTFFGEMLPQHAFEAASKLAENAPLLIAMGSSLTVKPAALIPELTVRAGGKLAIINAQPTPLDEFAAYRHYDLQAFCDAVASEFGEGE